MYCTGELSIVKMRNMVVVCMAIVLDIIYIGLKKS